MAGDGHPRQMTIPGTRVPGTELGLRLDQRGPPDLVRRVAELPSPTRRHDGRSILRRRRARGPRHRRHRATRTGHRQVPRRSDPDAGHATPSAAGKGKQTISFYRELPHPHLHRQHGRPERAGRRRLDARRQHGADPRRGLRQRQGRRVPRLPERRRQAERSRGRRTPRAAALRVQGFLTDFFPWVKAGVKAGEQWADTNAKATTAGTDSVVVKRVTTYRVVGKDTRDRGRRSGSRATTSRPWPAPSPRRTGPPASKARARARASTS